jgi:myo-inositol 2-dehydrogenase / D-chiro-inositol 1-dehydrogenase
MNTKRIRVALLGAGRIGQEHARTLIGSPQVSLVTVCDARLEAAQQIVAKAPGATAISDTAEVFSSKDIDAVVICTPTGSHADLIEAGARTGKAVFCEKPVALDLERTKKALKLVNESGIPFQIGFQRRFDTGYAEARRKIDRNLIGRIDQFRSVGRDPAPPPREYLETSGGLFLDQMIHEIDLARFLVGEVESVAAWGAARFSKDAADFGDVDTATTLLRFKNGALGVIENSRRAIYGYDIVTEVFGERGKLVVHAERKSPLRHYREGGSEEDHFYFFMDRFKDAFQAELESFFACVQEGRPPAPGAVDAAEALRIGIAATRSFKEGREVRLEEIQ